MLDGVGQPAGRAPASHTPCLELGLGGRRKKLRMTTRPSSSTGLPFNAVYAEDSQETEWASERRSFREYFGKIVGLDKDNVVYDAIWERFSHEIRVFLNNRYVFEPFWKYHNGAPEYDEWEDSFDRSKRAAGFALARQDTSAILSILFDRLYVLRNQLVHGGATWRSSVNRDQVRDGRRIVVFLVPRLVQIMVSNPREPWGAPYYPVVQGTP